MTEIIKVNYPKDMMPVAEFNETLYQEELSKLTNEAFADASTTVTLKNIKEALSKHIRKVYNVSSKEELTRLTSGFLALHGLSDDRFDPMGQFAKFMTSKANDVSIDDNANKDGSSIKGTLKEIELPFDKLIGYDYLYRTLKELNGTEEAKRLTALLYDFSLAIGDSTNILIPYSYYGNTPVLIKINEEVKYISLKNLYKLLEDFAEYNEQLDAYFIDTTNISKEFVIEEALINGSFAKIGNAKNGKKVNSKIKQLPRELVKIKVWDTNNGWVNVSQMVKHKNEKDFVLYQLEHGDFAMVTEDHPVYMADGTEKLAGDLVIGDKVLSDEMNLPEITKNIIIPEKLAYFLGFALGDGKIESGNITSILGMNKEFNGINFTRSGRLISLYQNDIDNSYIKKIVNEVFENPNYFKFSDKSDRCISFNSYDLLYLCSKYFGYTYKENSFTKHLPENFMQWTDESQEAFLAGLIDADGTIFNNEKNRCSIRLMSYATINGLYDALKNNKSFYKIKKRIDGNSIDNCIYELSLKISKNSKLITLSEKVAKAFEEDSNIFNSYNDSMDNSKDDYKVSKIIRFNSKDISNTRFLKKETEDVYDITTETGRFYANGMVSHNCWAFDSTKIVMLGRPFGQLPSKPAKRVSSYIAALCETVHQMSSHLAGACALGTLFLDIAHLLIYKQRISYDKLCNNAAFRKQLENELQQFIHSVNHLSRNSVESPFTNVSIFDKEKLMAFINEDNYQWYFPKHIKVLADNELGDENGKISREDFDKFIVDYIFEIQKIFIDLFDRGDPIQNGLQYRFPVVTVNLTKHVNSEGKYELDENNELLDYISKKDIARYNIFSSEGTKIASCCFKGDEIVKFYKEDDEFAISLREFVAKYTDKFGILNLPEDIYVDSLNSEGNLEKAKVTKLLYKNNSSEELIEINIDDNIINVTPDHILKVKNIETDEIIEITASEFEKNSQKYLLPVIQFNLIEWKATKSVKRNYEQKCPVYDIELEKNHYFPANNIITHNCRMINDEEMMNQLGSTVNSFGGSGGASLGSHRVVTINFARIAYMATSYDNYKELLKQRVSDAAKILKAHKILLLKMTDMGAEPFIKMGWIDMQRMFSTFGVLGIYEAHKILVNRFDNKDFDYTEDILKNFTDYTIEAGEKEGIIVNREQIPAESMAPKLFKADELLYGNSYNFNHLYANQFVPTWEKASIAEKMRIEGKYEHYLSGGSIAHLQISSSLTSSQSKNIIKKAVEYGLEHFALNTVYARCTECGFVEKANWKECPKCHSEKTQHLTRVIGFFTVIENWNKTRREYDAPNRYFFDVKELD